MLDAYLNQQAEYQRLTGRNERGQPVYDESESIPCRYQRKIQNMVTSTGQTIKVQHIFYTKKCVNEGDILNGLVIMAIADWVDLFGEIIGCKAGM